MSLFSVSIKCPLQCSMKNQFLSMVIKKKERRAEETKVQYIYTQTHTFWDKDKWFFIGERVSLIHWSAKNKTYNFFYCICCCCCCIGLFLDVLYIASSSIEARKSGDLRAVHIDVWKTTPTYTAYCIIPLLAKRF